VDVVKGQLVTIISGPATNPPILGPELITNGTFDADSDWSKGAGWSISGGSASCDGSQPANTNLIQNGVTADTLIYEVLFTLSGYSAGTVRPIVGVTANGTLRSANGTYKERITATDAGGQLICQGNSTFVGNIDDVSIKQVL
jgi:hypothetical protein